MSDQHFNPNDKVRIKREYDHRLVGGGTIAGERLDMQGKQYLVHSVFGGYSPNERPEIIEDWYPAKALELVEAAADQLEPRHLSEVDADERGVLLAENRRLAERCEQLEAALRGMVEGSIPAIPAGYSASNEQVNPPVCRMIDYDTWMAAKALLDGQG